MYVNYDIPVLLKDILRRFKEKGLKGVSGATLQDSRKIPLWVCKGGDLTGIYGYDVYYNRTNYGNSVMHP